MKKFFVPVVALVLVAGALAWWYGRNDGPPVVPSESAETSSGMDARIVFAADFATGDGCATHNSGGCDLYAAEIDWEGNARDVRRVTSAKEAETFPVFSADGSTAYANVVYGGNKWNIEWASLEGAAMGTLIANAAGPAPLPNGDSLVYVTLPGYAISQANFASSSSVGSAHVVNAEEGFHEPHASVNGQVVFYRLFHQGKGSNTAQVVVFDPITGKTTSLSESDGTAHCFWNGTGTGTVCNNTGLYKGLFTIAASGPSLGESALLLRHPTVEQVAAVDPDFAECRGASYAYGTFCDESHMIVTVGCGVETDGVVDTTMSKLGLIDVSADEPTLIPLGKNLADAFGGPGSSSYTVDCMTTP